MSGKGTIIRVVFTGLAAVALSTAAVLFTGCPEEPEPWDPVEPVEPDEQGVEVEDPVVAPEDPWDQEMPEPELPEPEEYEPEPEDMPENDEEGKEANRHYLWT